MRKVSLPVKCLIVLSILFKLSLYNYHSCKMTCKKNGKIVSNSNYNQQYVTAFKMQESEFEIIHAP